MMDKVKFKKFVSNLDIDNLYGSSRLEVFKPEGEQKYLEEDGVVYVFFNGPKLVHIIYSNAGGTYIYNNLKVHHNGRYKSVIKNEWLDQKLVVAKRGFPKTLESIKTSNKNYAYVYRPVPINFQNGGQGYSAPSTYSVYVYKKNNGLLNWEGVPWGDLK